MLIKQIINILNIEVTLFKIKVYLENKLNDKADSLANVGHNQPTISFKIQNHISMSFTFEDEPLDKAISKFWKNQTQAESFNNYIEMKRNINIKRKTRDNIIDWCYCLNYLNKAEDNSHSTSFTSSNFVSFKTHIIFKELPMIQHLSHKYHDIYE